MKPYDNYEISPCTRTEEPDKPGLYYFEVCEPHEADVWTLYGHLPEGGVEAIGDFATREAAEQTFQRITGNPFGDPDEVAAHLRVMHAGQNLLAAVKLCHTLIRRDGVRPDIIEGIALHDRADRATSEAIAEATGRAA